jgi:hypothetical protein
MVADAIEKAEEVLKDVNEAARKHENKQKLSELSRLVDLEGLEVRAHSTHWFHLNCGVRLQVSLPP